MKTISSDFHRRLQLQDKLLWQRDKLHSTSDLSVIATEFTPVYRQIQRKQSDVFRGTVMEGTGAGGDGDEGTSTGDRDTDAFDDEDDEIEDW